MTDGIFLPTKIYWSGFCRLQLAFVLEKRKKVAQAGDLSDVGYRRSKNALLLRLYPKVAH